MVGHVERVDRQQFDLHGPAPLSSKEIEAGIDGQAMEPGVEAIRITEPRQIAPGANETVLNGVLRQLGIAKDQASGRVKPSKGAVDQHGEGVVIASPRSIDKLRLVQGRLGRAHRVVFPTGYGVRIRRNVHRHAGSTRPMPIVQSPSPYRSQMTPTAPCSAGPQLAGSRRSCSTPSISGGSGWARRSRCLATRSPCSGCHSSPCSSWGGRRPDGDPDGRRPAATSAVLVACGHLARSRRSPAPHHDRRRTWDARSSIATIPVGVRHGRPDHRPALRRQLPDGLARGRLRPVLEHAVRRRSHGGSATSRRCRC